jgi:cytochrome P450
VRETMRLFLVSTNVNTRIAQKDMEVGDLIVPKGIVIELARQVMQKDPEYWGEDVDKFNPGRFLNGVSKAHKHPQAFAPFGYGPKTSIAMGYAMNELKIVLSMILKRFQIGMSPSYKHHPALGMVQKPKYGMPLILKSLA